MKAPQIIIWDVGQGQWVSFSENLFCLHMDMGGERMDWLSLRKECGRKRNYLFLTHGDWDHVNFIKKARTHLKKLCLFGRPLEKISSKKEKMLGMIPVCEPRKFPFLKKVLPPSSRRKKLSSNDLSVIYVLFRKFLNPGDSTRRQEKNWVKKIPSSVIWLLLGHHGSQTSTSPFLLKKLPQIQQAFVSSRKRRYGHPHKKVLFYLKKQKIPLLETDVWGNLRISLSQEFLRSSSILSSE